MHDVEEPPLAAHVDVGRAACHLGHPSRLAMPNPPFPFRDQQRGVVQEVHAPRCLEAIDQHVGPNRQVVCHRYGRCLGLEFAFSRRPLQHVRRQFRHRLVVHHVPIGRHAQQLVAFADDPLNVLRSASQFPRAPHKISTIRSVTTAAELRVRGRSGRGVLVVGDAVDPTCGHGDDAQGGTKNQKGACHGLKVLRQPRPSRSSISSEAGVDR